MINTRDFIKDARRRLGDNQQQFADRIHTSIRTIHGWERKSRTHSPDATKILLIEKILEEEGV